MKSSKKRPANHSLDDDFTTNNDSTNEISSDSCYSNENQESTDDSNDGSENLNSDIDNPIVTKSRKRRRRIKAPQQMESSEDEDHEEDPILAEFVSETFKRAEAVAMDNTHLTVPLIMKALKVRGPIILARRTKKLPNLWNLIQSKEKNNAPRAYRIRVKGPSGKLIPNPKYRMWIKKKIYTDTEKMAFYNKMLEEMIAKRKALVEEDDLTPIRNIQEHGVKSLSKLAISLRDHGVHTIIMAVPDKEVRPLLLTTKGYAEKYWQLMSQSKPTRSLPEFRGMVYGTNTFQESVDATKKAAGEKTKADGSLERGALRNKLRVKLIEAISMNFHTSINNKG